MGSMSRSSMFSFTISSNACCDIDRTAFGGPISRRRRRTAPLLRLRERERESEVTVKRRDEMNGDFD